MSISKEQWKAIEAELKKMWVNVEFKLAGHSIQVCRRQKTESTTVLAVYIDNTIEGKWCVGLDEIPAEDAFMNEVVKRVWFTKTKCAYSKKRLDEMEKLKRKIGVRRFKELVGEDPKSKVYSWLMPSFGSSTVLVRQFKKIEGLELVTELKEVAA